ncbi:MAG: RNA-binding protein [Acidimicrobiia bacterium]|nr:RNA-binding protein [Acidimicrobiia bacterium]
MKIYVGNLPFSTTNRDLETMFEKFGTVESAQVVTDRDTGRSRGFGFVEMADDAARKAIDELGDTDIDGRRLTVNEAKPRPQGGGDRRPDRNRSRSGGWSR